MPNRSWSRTNLCRELTASAATACRRRLSESISSVAAVALQASFDDLGTHLSQVTFCVVDLETTGGAETDMITEFGAVKVRGGEVLGEFQTLVNPQAHIPPLIAVLTGITNQMVANAPGAGARSCPRSWPLRREPCSSLTTRRSTSASCAVPARRATIRSRAGRWSTPRPWPDRSCSATRCRTAGWRHWLGTFTRPSRRTTARSPTPRRPSRCCTVCSNGSAILACTPSRIWPSSAGGCHRSGAPSAPGPPPCRPAPGVYLFVAEHDEQRHILYVGKSKNIRARVRNYFTAAEKRPRIDEMVRLATGVEAVPCVTQLQADVTELRLIGSQRTALQPSLQVPRTHPVDQDHRRAVSPAVDGPRGPR